MKKVVHLFTPGLDSYLANYFLTKQEEEGKIELKRVYFNLDSKYSHLELDFLRQFYSDDSGMFLDFVEVLEHLKIRELEEDDAHVPNRNLLLVTLAAAKHDPDIIYINGMKDDRVSDNKKEFFEKVSEVLSMSMEKEIVVTSLFWEKEKTEAITEFIDDGGPRFDLVLKTYSCFDKIVNRENVMLYEYNNGTFHSKPGEIPNTYNTLGTFPIYGCRACPACYRRFCALTAANVFIPFLDFDMTQQYKTKIDENKHPHRFTSVQSFSHFSKYYKDLQKKKIHNVDIKTTEKKTKKKENSRAGNK